MTTILSTHTTTANAVLHVIQPAMDNEPTLPVELEREIFETAALMYPSNIPTLLRVAHRVLFWIEPLLYRVVRLGSSTEIDDAILGALKSKPPAFFHGAVRHLGFGPSRPLKLQELSKLLARCSGVVNLTIAESCLHPEMMSLLGQMPLQRLSISLGKLFGGFNAIDLSHGLFTRLTHLDIDDSDGASTLPFATLPALTHLCLNDGVRWHTIENILSTCPRLEALVHTRDPPESLAFRDVRYVLGGLSGYWAGWEAGANGFPDFWSRADDIVARRRRGEIPDYFIVSPRNMVQH